MTQTKELDNRRLYHYLVLLLEDLDRESFQLLRHLCQKEVESYDELIGRTATTILKIPDDELKEFKQEVQSQKNQQVVMQTLLNTYLDHDFVRSKAESLLQDIKHEEEKKKNEQKR